VFSSFSVSAFSSVFRCRTGKANQPGLLLLDFFFVPKDLCASRALCCSLLFLLFDWTRTTEATGTQPLKSCVAVEGLEERSNNNIKRRNENNKKKNTGVREGPQRGHRGVLLFICLLSGLHHGI
jgi:hypothetical protein